MLGSRMAQRIFILVLLGNDGYVEKGALDALFVGILR